MKQLTKKQKQLVDEFASRYAEQFLSMLPQGITLDGVRTINNNFVHKGVGGYPTDILEAITDKIEKQYLN